MRRCVVRAVQHQASARRHLVSSAALNDDHPIAMPALSPTMESGTIKEWLVKPGDQVEEGDELCTVETDKAVVSYETLQEGTIAKIFMEAGSGAKVGDIIAVMVDEGDDWQACKYTPGSATAAAATPV